MRTAKNRIDPALFSCKVDNEYQRWMARYLPVEREIMNERDRREERRWQRRQDRNRSLSRAFGDLCEATKGRARIWRKDGFCSFEMAFEMATDAWTRKTAERYFKLSGEKSPRLPRLSEIVSSLVMSHLILTFNMEAVISCCALQLIVKLTGKVIADLKRRAARPLYYERETTRRKALAKDRRRITMRTTVNACPVKEAVLEAYIHRKDSKEAAIRFGSLIHDLECYVDNSLRFAEGRITGRNQGVKGWLSENIPALVCKYTTVMRYKAAAKKLKQLTELDDPYSADAVLMSDAIETAAGNSNSEECKVPNEKVLRAIAIFKEISEGVQGATQMFAKIDAYLDPKRVEEATTLAIWRERYRNEITVRNKSRWWRRFLRSATKRKSAIIPSVRKGREVRKE